ncbi:MAG: SNF2-related protein, partial [Bacteroidales bacterium]
MQTIDPGKTAAVYHTLQQLTSPEQQALKILALYMEEFSESDMVWNFEFFQKSTNDCRHFFKKMQEAGIIVRAQSIYSEYILHPVYHVAILLEIGRNKEEKLFNENKEYIDSPFIKEFLNRFYLFISKKEDWIFNDEVMLNPTLLSLLYFFPYFEELIPVYCGFSINLRKELFDKYIQNQIIMLRPVNEVWLSHYLLNMPDLLPAQREVFEEAGSLSRIVFHANIRQWEQIGRTTLPGALAHALWLQVNGEIPQALAVYEEIIKAYNQLHPYDKVALPPFRFYNFCYALTLIQEGSDKSKKKIQALLKKKEVKENNLHFAVYLLLSTASESAFTNDISRMAVYRVTNPLDSLLYTWICKNYQITQYEVPYTDEALYLIRQDQFKLLWIESARFYPELKENLSLNPEEKSLAPLMPQYIKPKPWELVLNKLLEDTEPVVKTKAVAQTAASRIIYLLSDTYEITPVLQKSKDGITWKGGRKIAVKTFAEGIPEMNDTDKQIAATARRVTSRWGYNYEYLLEGEKTIAALAGYPLVFMQNNPDVPVEIIKETPYLSVTKEADRFRIDTNVIETGSNSLIQVSEENNTRFSVLELTVKQQQLILRLLKLKEYPLEAAPLLRELLSRISKEVDIHSDLIENQPSVQQKEGNTIPVVQILPLGEHYKAELFVKPLCDYPPYCKAGVGNRSVMGHVEGIPVQALRNFRKEIQNQEVISHIFNELKSEATDVIILESITDCLELLEQLNQLGDLVRIEWPEGVKMNIRHYASSSDFSVSVKGENTWFQIDGALSISKNEEMHILELMKKVSESESRFIHLTGTDYLAITEQLRQQLRELNSFMFLQKGKYQLSEFSAPLLESLEKGGIQLSKDTAYQKLIKRIADVSKTDYLLPNTLQASLREYQEEGFRWLSRLADWGAGACLADDMGLGKTVQAISVMLSKAENGPILVVAPASVLSNWENEIIRFAPSLSVRNLNQTSGERSTLISEAADFEVVITTYGLLVMEEQNLCNKKWSMVVLDEAHTIKNRNTKMSKSAMKLKADFRLILTGTPVQNHLSEIWNLFEFINPGLLGTFQNFSERFIVPIELRQDKAQQRLLKKILSPFILRRTKNEVLNELPGKTEIIHPVELSAKEMMLYETLRRKAEMSLQGGDLN